MKKTEFFTIKVTPELKKKLQREADKREWTLSHYTRKLIETAQATQEDNLAPRADENHNHAR